MKVGVVTMLLLSPILVATGCNNVHQGQSKPLINGTFDDNFISKLEQVTGKSEHSFQVLIPHGGLGLINPDLKASVNGTDEVRWDIQETNPTIESVRYQLQENPHSFKPDDSFKEIDFYGTKVYKHSFDASDAMYVFTKGNTDITLIISGPITAFPDDLISHLSPDK